MRDRLKNSTHRTVRLLALSALLIFLATAFRAGFLRDETDFPNYYTAAVLVRKGEPLHQFYDWTWFAREMDKAGLTRHIGNYTPHTPLTMLPMVGLAGLSVQHAKQVWLVCNLFFLAGTLWMLSQIAGRTVEQLWLFTFCGYFSLYSNFLLGQYYVFLMFLLGLTLYLLHRGQFCAGGIAAGVAFSLKLYGGPYLLYFIATRKWKSVAGMIAAVSSATAVAVALFGWPDVRNYALQVLPRSLEGGAIDPYNPQNQTMSTLLRICFLRDQQLHPHPLWNAPAVFFFLRAFFGLTIVLFLYLGARKADTVERDFGWFVIALLLLSTNVSSYTFVLMLLPFVLLIEGCGPLQSTCLAVSCVLLTFPLRLAWLFPKVWLLFGLFVMFGWERWRKLAAKSLALATIAIVLCSTLITWKQMQKYEEEPGRHAQQISAGGITLFSSFPVVTPAGLFFQSMGHHRYFVRWLHDTYFEEIWLEGNAFRPWQLADGSIGLESVDHGTSKVMRFDPATRSLTPSELRVPMIDTSSAMSPDGKWLAYTSDETWARHLWLRNLDSGQVVRVAGGNCNSSWPAWELDSRSIVFASDCGRALGLPTLYRMQIPDPTRLVDVRSTATER